MKLFKNKSLFFNISKIIIKILGILIIIVLLFIGFLFASEWIFPQMHGSYNLGHGIYMMEWDGGGRVIVYGTSISGNTCYGGTPLIPTYNNQYDSLGRQMEYVVDAKSNKRWIIVKTNNKMTHQKKIYIIDKDCNTQEKTSDNTLPIQILNYNDSLDFAKACNNKGIKINW